MAKTLTKLIQHLSDPRLRAVLKIQSVVLSVIQNFFRDKGFLELSPVMISPITDPLCHSVYDAEIDYEGQKLKLTKSMIFHKQLALSTLTGLEKIFIISPNIRLEPSKYATERHLIEFQQIDFEIRDAVKEDIYRLIEELIIKVIEVCKTRCADDLKFLGRKLPEFFKPFEVIKTGEAVKKYGEDFERILSEKKTEPFFLESFDREFYDKEDENERGKFLNYDLIYPEGFEEGLSGGEREFEYETVIRKMEERKMSKDVFSTYLELSKEKLIPKTAGGGLGLQRLLRYLTGIREIEKVVLFPRSPRNKIIF